jgi:hypothetical protein
MAEAARYLSPVQKVLAGVITVAEPLSTCPRCRDGAIRALGDVRSSLEWYHCRGCDRVWAAKRSMRPPPPVLISSRWGLRALVSTARACVAVLLAHRI